MKEFDRSWRFEALKLAAMEQLEINGKLDLNTLFKQSKHIYHEGYKNHIEKWEPFWLKKEKLKSDLFETNKPKVKKEISKTDINKIKVKEGFKLCPNCNEEVPITWKNHTYKNDRTKCGHEFEE